MAHLYSTTIFYLILFYFGEQEQKLLNIYVQGNKRLSSGFKLRG